MVRILGVVLLVNWIGYGVLILAGASHRTTYMAMSFLYIAIGLLFLGGILPLVRHFLFFQEKALNEFPPGFARSFAGIVFGQVGMYRSKLEWLCITVLGGTVFLVLGIALFCLAAGRMASYKYLMDSFR